MLASCITHWLRSFPSLSGVNVQALHPDEVWAFILGILSVITVFVGMFNSNWHYRDDFACRKESRPGQP